MGREGHGLAKTIRESIYIRVNNPTLNRNIGKYYHNHIWDTVLLNTPKLKINSSKSMQTEHALVGMLSLFQPIGIQVLLGIN